MRNIKGIIPYIAGYIDGDGCFYVGKYIQKTKMIIVFEYSIQIVSVKYSVLDVFRKEFGGYICIKPFKKRHKTAHCWTIKGSNAINVARCILPYLIDKPKQCSFFIQFSELIYGNNFKTVESKCIDKREVLINNIRKDKHMNNLVTKEAIEALKKRANIITPIQEDYMYLAGLIDSEGCFRIKKWKPKNRSNNVYNISLEIGSTKFLVIPWLVERFGGSVTYVPAKSNKRACAIWTLSAAALYNILHKIQPFLFIKIDVCNKLIEFQKTILPNGGDRHSELFRAFFEKRREIREKIIEEVHALNRKGSH